MGRCSWANDPKMIEYHDAEWGIPCHDDRVLFELLILEGMQAGLSWSTILNKREAFRKAFDDFDAEKIAKYDSAKISELMSNKEIIRNRLKIHAAIENAKGFLKIKQDFGTFDKYVWKFVSFKPIENNWDTMEKVPCVSKESGEMAKELKKRGFKFVGTKICYSFMQAVGMVNDHLASCRCKI